MTATIDYFVKRVHAPVQPATGEVWLINGGPGLSGVYMECMVGAAQRLTAGTVDFVIPDHRGTGRSSPLTCGNNRTVSNAPECVAATVAEMGLPQLHQYSTSNAARDVHAAMVALGSQARRLQGYKVVVHGVSYGTYLSQRFLQLYPNAADGVLLDGVCAPDLIRIPWAAPLGNTVGTALMQLCEADPSCRAKFPGGAQSPLYRTQLLFELLHAGRLPCNAKLALQVTPDVVRRYFSDAVRADPGRLLIPPVVARLLRCNNADVAALDHLFGHMISAGTPFGPSKRLRLPGENSSLVSNALLGFNVGAGEFFQYADEPVDSAAVIGMRRGLLFGNNGDDSQFVSMQAPGFAPYTDPLSHRYPNTTANMLLIVGSLDPQTVPHWAEHAKQTAYPGLNQRLVIIPNAVHAVASLPGLSRVAGGGPDCAFEIAASFYASGGAVVNTSCLDRMLPLDFAGVENRTRAMAVAAMGTADMWDGAPATDRPQI